MATELRLRRGNTAATSTFVGAEGEVTVNTTKDSLVVHDGVTAGGFEAARADLNNVSNSTFASKALAANVGGNISGNITGASTVATYVTIGSEGGILPYSRRLQAGNGITLSDGGAGGGVSIASNFATTAPANLGAASVGASNQVSRADHVHQLPTASQIGAASQNTYIIAGNGIVGTGNLSSNVTLSLNANLNTLTDVYTTNATNGDILVYDSATAKWNNTQNFPRMTIRKGGTLIGTANTVAVLNIIAGNEVAVTSANAQQANITIPTIFSASEIQNYAGGVVSSGTNGGITANYDSVNKRTNFSANAFTLTVSGAVTGSQTISNLGNATITTTLPQNSVQLGFHTTGSYLSNVLAGAGTSITYSANSAATIETNVSSSTFTMGARDAMNTGFLNGTQNGVSIVYNRSANAFSVSANTFTVTLTGPITGTNVVTNLSNVSIATQMASGAVTLGTHTTGNYVANVAVSGNGLSVSGGVGAGATLTVSSNGTNLNTPNTLISRDSGGNFSAGNITASLNGLASLNLPLSGGALTGALILSGDPTNSLHAATKQYVDNAGANSRVVLTGDVTGNAVASGVSTTLSSTGVVAGTYKSVTVDVKGRVTAGSNPTTLSGYGITDAVSTSGAQAINGVKTFNNDVTIGGNLVVTGATTSISTNDLSVVDKTIIVSRNATSGTTADQSGIQVAGAGANFLYDNTTNGWMMNKNVMPAVNGTYDIGSDTMRWRNMFLGGNLTVSGTINASVSGSVTTAGNITGGFTYSVPYQSAPGTTAMLAAGTAGYLLMTNGGLSAPAWKNPSDLSVNYAATAGSATSATTAGTVSSAAQSSITSVGVLTGLAVSGGIAPAVSSNASVNLGGPTTFWNNTYTVGLQLGTSGATTYGGINPGANASISLGTASAWYNDVYAVTFRGVSTTAKYADLAEKYLTDREYEVGTVIAVGGDAEVTASQSGDLAIGVISAAPAYLMNSEAGGQAVALKGRVPVRVVGVVKKGQQLVAAEDGTARAVDGGHLNKFAVALETNNDAGIKLVEAIIL